MVATLSLPEAPATVQKTPAAGARADYALNVVLVYQDEPTRKWAAEIFDHAARLVGPQHVRGAWWSIYELGKPEALTAAVAATMQTDVVVVAVRAADELPLAFYHWSDLWLPRGPRGSGALIALLGFSGSSRSLGEGTRHYLKTLAQRGGLDFLVHERKLAADPRSSVAHWREPARFRLHE
jgi:hypothetical protein